MRYILEPTSREGKKLVEDFSADERNFKLIDQYEPTERLTRTVEQIGLALREYQRQGISWEIFVMYLRGKGHSRRTIDAVMGDVREFFRKMGMLE